MSCPDFGRKKYSGERNAGGVQDKLRRKYEHQAQGLIQVVGCGFDIELDDSAVMACSVPYCGLVEDSRLRIYD